MLLFSRWEIFLLVSTSFLNFPVTTEFFTACLLMICPGNFEWLFLYIILTSFHCSQTSEDFFIWFSGCPGHFVASFSKTTHLLRSFYFILVCYLFSFHNHTSKLTLYNSEIFFSSLVGNPFTCLYLSHVIKNCFLSYIFLSFFFLLNIFQKLQILIRALQN